MDGLADPKKKRNYFAAKMKEFAAKVSSVNFHDSFYDMKCSNPKYSKKLKSYLKECTNQDLRELRCAAGTTKLGRKSILKCTKCGLVIQV